MEVNKKNKSADMIDVAGIAKQYAAKWYVFVISIVICVSLAFLYTRISNPKYIVKANVLVAQTDDPIASTAGGLGSLLTGSNGYVEDEVFVVSSHTVLTEVVKKNELNRMHYVKDGLRNELAYKDYPVDLFCDPSIPDTISVGLTFKVKVNDNGKVNVSVKKKFSTIAEVKDATFPVTISTPYGKYILNKTKFFPKDGKGLKTTIKFCSYNAAAEALAKDIVIDIASRKSNVITLDMKTTNIDYAKDILNSVIAEYNIQGVADKNVRNTKTLEFIDSRLALLGGDLSESEMSIENYKKRQGITDVAAEATYQMTKRGQLEQDLITTETELKVIQIIREFLNNPAHKYDLVPGTLTDPREQGPLSAYNDLLLKRIGLMQNAREGNAGLAALDEQIDAMRKNVISSINRSHESALVALRKLQDEMNSAESRLGNIPTQEREFRDIKRQQAIKEQLYIFLLQRREETSMLLANTQPKGQIVDAAYALSEPVSLGTSIVLALGLLMGLLFAMLYIYISKLFRNKFDSREEAEKLIDAPILGEVCTSKREETMVVRDGGSTSAAELFRLIRTNLQFILGNEDHSVIMVTSTVSGEGKSFVSINLASSLALLGKRVLLMGLDIRNPKLAEYLNLPPCKGFTDYIANPAVHIDEIVRVAPLMANLDIITSGPVPPNPSELLSSHRVDDLFARLRQTYDYIIMDTAPVGMVSDTFSLVRVSDATVYVCRANFSTHREIHFINDLYRDKRVKRLSVVVNGTKARQGYGYGQKGTVS